MATKYKDWNRDMFFDELRRSVENVMQGLSQVEEYDWGDEGKVGFRISRENGGAIIEVK